MPKEPFKIVFDAINQNVDAFPENQAEDVIFVCYWMDYTFFFLTVHYSTLLSNENLTVRCNIILQRDAYPHIRQAT